MPDFQILPGDLILVKGHDFISRPIEEITHSAYSHVAGYISKGDMIEAQSFRKTGYQPLEAYTGESDVYRCDSLTFRQRVGIVIYAKKQIGKRYNYLLILWEFLRYVLHIMLPMKEGQSNICSTLWNDAYQSVGVSLCPGVLFPSPGDLAQSSELRKVGSF